jgi:hypothetical protein
LSAGSPEPLAASDRPAFHLAEELSMPTFLWPNGDGHFDVPDEIFQKASLAWVPVDDHDETAGIVFSSTATRIRRNLNPAGPYYAHDPLGNRGDRVYSVVPLTSLPTPVIGPLRLKLYKPDNLVSVLSAIHTLTKLDPIDVSREMGRPRSIENGYHRYIASVIYGYTKIPIFEPPLAPARKAQTTAPKYIPPHLRNRGVMGAR